jgi:predicted amidohydrolase YtcJ
MTAPPLSRSGFLRARRVLTGPPAKRAEAVWWEDGIIKGVGQAAGLHRLISSGTPEFDLPDCTVTPGFVDGHTHFAHWALNRQRVELAGTRSREEVLANVGRAVPVQGWVMGQGWDANGWPVGPDRWSLDAIQSGPVYLDSLDVHAAWVNSEALAIAGITRDTADPYGGRIVRDAAGEATGLLLERAVELMIPYLPQPPDDHLEMALLDAQREAHRVGVTGIHDVEGLPVLRAFERLESSRRLELRVLFHPPVDALPELIRSALRSGTGSDRLVLGGVKMFLDGSLGSRTAWMLEPYEGSGDRGMPITAEAVARDAMRAAAGAGLACTVHAIGDAAVRRALDLMEPLPSAAIPHRIEHFQCVHPRDLERAARAGIILSMQPAHLLTDVPLVERHWGNRGRGAYAFRTLRRAGATLVFGSDVPVASIDPREGVFAALERRAQDGTPAGGWRPEEKLTFDDVVDAYTVNPALAAGTGAGRGTLAPGQDADLVAWKVDASIDHDDGFAFRAAHTALTVVAGRVVMQA